MLSAFCLLAKCTTCKAVPPLPKNLAALRFSGALFFPRSRTGLLRSLLCHFDLVVTRLCCQHFAVWQNARLARRLLLFPKISLRCDFREPCLIARRVEKSCAVRCGKQTLLPCLERLTVLYKIPLLTLGMTRTVFVFRDPSTRAGCARARSG